MSRFRTGRTAANRRRGFTLVEFSVSSLIVGILMAGMASCIHLVTRAARLSAGPTSVTTDAARVMEEILSDLRLAQVFHARSQDRVEFTIPDRDGDDAPEIIQYQWTGGPASVLEKTLDFSGDVSPPVPAIVATDVREFSLEYLLKTCGSQMPVSEIESDEVLLVAHDVMPTQAAPRVLLVVNETANLSPSESTLRAFMEGWAMVVETIGATASQTDFRRAATREPGDLRLQHGKHQRLGNKLRYLPIGLVNELPEQVDELGLAGAMGTALLSSVLDDTIGTHYLTRGWIPEEQVKLFSTPQSVRGLTSDTALWSPNLQVIGRRSGQPSLAVLQTGEKLYQPAGSPPMKLGESQTLATRSALGATYVAARFTLDTTIQASNMSARLQGSLGAIVRLGIYADNAGNPGNLIAQTSLGTLLQTSSHWMTCNFASSFALPPGTYWLAIHLPSNVDIFHDLSGGTSRYASATLSTLENLRSSWSETTGPDPNERRFSIYLSGDEVPLARGRRVQMPWGSTGMMPQALSDEGQMLVKRAILWAAESEPEDAGSDYGVTATARPAQYLLPPLPQNATGWRITRVFCRLRSSPWSFFNTLTFRLHHANLAKQPSEFQLQQTYPILAYTWPSDRYVWYEIPFAPSRELPPDGGVCITWGGSSSAAPVTVNYDQSKTWMTPSSHLVESSDSGSSWSAANDSRDIRYYVYGKYLTQGDPIW